MELLLLIAGAVFGVVITEPRTVRESGSLISFIV